MMQVMFLYLSYQMLNKISIFLTFSGEIENAMNPTAAQPAPPVVAPVAAAPVPADVANQRDRQDIGM